MQKNLELVQFTLILGILILSTIYFTRYETFIATGANDEQVRITAPALLQGSRCYVDASTEPDQPILQPRLAGLGVFILNFQEQPAQAIYIKAKLDACTSVIMAEAASLALASAIIDQAQPDRRQLLVGL